MPQLMAIDSPISAVGLEATVVPQTSSGTTPQTAKGLFAEAMAVATAQVVCKTYNIGLDGVERACSVDCGELMSATPVVADGAAAGPLSRQGVAAVFASSEAQIVSDPVTQMVMTLLTGGSTGTNAEAHPAKVPVAKLGKASVAPAKTKSGSIPVNAVAMGVMRDSGIVVESESWKDGVRPTASGRSGQQTQAKEQTGSSESQVEIGIPENGGCAVAIVPVTPQTAGNSDAADTEQGSKTQSGAPVTSSVGITVPLSEPRSEPSDGSQTLSSDGCQVLDRIAEGGAANSVAAIGSQPVAADQAPAESEARQRCPGADMKGTRFDQDNSVASMPSGSEGSPRSSGLQSAAGPKDVSSVMRAVVSEGKPPVRGEDPPAAQSVVTVPLTGAPRAQQDEESSRTEIRPADYEPRTPREPGGAQSMIVGGGVKSAPGLASATDRLGDALPTAAGGHRQVSDTLGDNRVTEIVALQDSADPANVRVQADGTRATSSSIAGPAQDIGRQILDSMQASLTQGEREIQVRLHPPELGSVLVRFKEQDGQLHGLLEVSSGDMKREIERVLPQMLQSLRDQGTQVRRLDVTVADQTQGDSSRGQQQQDAWSRQSGSQGRDQLDGSPTHWSHPGEDSSALESPDVERPIDFSRSGLDMLL